MRSPENNERSVTFGVVRASGGAQRIPAERVGREATFPAGRAGSVSRGVPNALQQNDFSANQVGSLGPNAIFTLSFPVRQGKPQTNSN
jgi:hypothetical protein